MKTLNYFFQRLFAMSFPTNAKFNKTENIKTNYLHIVIIAELNSVQTLLKFSMNVTDNVQNTELKVFFISQLTPHTVNQCIPMATISNLT